MFSFTVLDHIGKLRRGLLETPHGIVNTPAFMPVATQGAVKALDPETVARLGSEMILANAYHLYLRPGIDVVAGAGGLHRFMGWERPILTDSGGFQVMSLAALTAIDEDGVTFNSHIDGSNHRLTPERVVEIEQALGPDFITPLDQCLPYPHDRRQAEQALERTERWLQRTIAARERSDQELFGIVQGGMFADLRQQATRVVAGSDVFGVAVGGLSVGEERAVTLRMLEAVAEVLPEEKPRYVMGAGSPELLIEACERGYDLFDCVLPTRLARHGTVLTDQGRLNIRNAAYERDYGPLEQGCECATCVRYSRAFVRHLVKSGEILGLQLTTIHNVHFIQRLMAGVRKVTCAEDWEKLKKQVVSVYG